MIVESIQRVFSITPVSTEQQVIKTLVDPKTDKEYREFVAYCIYNRAGLIEENTPQQVDLTA